MDTSQYEIDVINKWGAPYLTAKKLGGGYRPLISEEAMPTYVLVLKIVTIVHGVLILVVWGVGGFDPLGIFKIIFEMGRSLLSNAGIITIIFYILDRKQKFTPEDWKIEDLAELPKEDKIKVPSLLISIGMNSFLLMYFLLFPQWLGYGYFLGSKLGF